MTAFVSPDRIRGLFAQAMSDMYRAEVPLYGDLITLVGDINNATLQRDDASRSERIYAEGARHISESARKDGSGASLKVLLANGLLLPPVVGGFQGGVGLFEGEELFEGRPV